MKYINYNNNKLSKLALGSAQFGMKYGIANKDKIPKEYEVEKIIKSSIRLGINVFDTAFDYECAQNKVLNATYEEEVFIVSKIRVKDILEDYENNASFFALLLHDSNALSSWSEKKSKKIQVLKAKDKILYFGISIYNNQEFNMAIKCKDIDIIQVPFNLFDQRAIKQRWFEKAEKENKLLIIRSIFLQGLFFLKYNEMPTSFDKARNYFNKLDEICAYHNLSRLQLALAFVDNQVKNNIILFGCDNIYQLNETIMHYKTMPFLSGNIIEKIKNNFSNIPETIYDPREWKKCQV